MHVYCLMDNHYHLFLETPRGNLSQIMRHINGAYTTYFNRKRERAGHLFQGRYKAILVDADRYAGELSGYIHLNPVRAGIGSDPGDYQWSSFQYYTGNKKAPEWLKRDFILGYFAGNMKIAVKMYRDFVCSVMDQEYKNPLAELSHSIFLGGNGFVADIKTRFLGDKKEDRDLSTLKVLSKRPDIDDIEKIVDSIFKSDEKLARQMKLYMCHRFSGKKLRDIGKRFGITESGVTQASRRMKIKAEKENSVKQNIKSIENKIHLSNV